MNRGWTDPLLAIAGTDGRYGTVTFVTDPTTANSPLFV